MTNGGVATLAKMIEEYCDAIRTGDARRVVSQLAENVTRYDQAPPLQTRGAEARDPEELEAWLATFEGPVEIEMRSPTIRADGDLGFAYGLCRMHGKKKGAGQVDMWYRNTICFQRQNGEWKVVHEHSSVPFKMDGSEKALLDLKP